MNLVQTGLLRSTKSSFGSYYFSLYVCHPTFGSPHTSNLSKYCILHWYFRDLDGYTAGRSPTISRLTGSIIYCTNNKIQKKKFKCVIPHFPQPKYLEMIELVKVSVFKPITLNLSGTVSIILSPWHFCLFGWAGEGAIYIRHQHCGWFITTRKTITVICKYCYVYNVTLATYNV